MKLPLVDPTRLPTPARKTGHPFWRDGFRPFFLGATVSALGAVALWIPLYAGHSLGGFAPLAWHRHEMLFGFAGAVIAGFLLTAPGNWTGRPMPQGRSLMALFALWVAGRLVMAVPACPPVWRLAVNAAFLPAVALAMAIPVIRAGNFRNLVFVPLLAALTAAQVGLHLAAQGVGLPATAASADLGLGLVLVMITLVGGRIVPFFTGRALGIEPPTAPPAVAAAAPPLVLLAVLAEAACPQPPGRALAWLLAAVAVAWRSVAWHRPAIWRHPLLWSLHLSFHLLALGGLLKAAAALEWVAPMLARHALSVGTVGLICLSMMARVSRGHTGRPMTVDGLTVASLRLAVAAALVRALLPLVWPAGYGLSVLAAAGLWCAATLLLLLGHLPLWLGPPASGSRGR